jgi:hypothetical protein
MALLMDCLPEFCNELRVLSLESGHPEIAEQVGSLRLVDRCRCSDDFCGTFYTAPKPRGSYGPKHENLELPAKDGMIILDLIEGRIHCVEVLYRDDIRSRLCALLP